MARRPCSGPFMTLVPRQLWEGKPAAGRPAGPRRSVGRHPVRLPGPVQHVLALRGALSRRRPGRGVHVRGAFRRLLEGRRGSTTFAIANSIGGDRRLLRAASVHDQLDAGELHAPGLPGSHGPGGRRPGRRCSVGRGPAATAPAHRTRSRLAAGRWQRAPGSGGPTCSWSARRRPGPRRCTDELARHPAIYMSPMKEPHFFSRIEPAPEREAFFPHRDRRGRVPGAVRGRHRRASWWGRRAPPTSGTAHAAERIKRVVPEARILIMLRDPVERAYSQYWNDVREGIEKRSFLDALAEEQRSGPGAWGVSSLYIDCGRYADQVEQVPRAVRRPGPGAVLRGVRRGRGEHDRGGPLVPGRGAAGRPAPRRGG